MQPAFSSTKQAAAFTLLLLVLLLLPVVMVKSWLPSREQCYSTIWWANGDFPYLDQQIFSEKGDIDIAFMGASHVWYGIDAPYIQQKLSEKLGRPAVVRCFGWGGSGDDALYFVAKDILAHRKVHLLVFYDAIDEVEAPHAQMTHLFRYADDAGDLKGLSWQTKAVYYFAAVLGMPRNLLGLLRPDLPADLVAPKSNFLSSKGAEDIATRLGSLAEKVSFAPGGSYQRVPYEAFTPNAFSAAKDFSIYSETTKDRFSFADSSISPAHLYFIKLLVNLARENQTGLVLLHMPILSDKRNPAILERSFWRQFPSQDLTIAGIPPASVFDGISDANVVKLYGDSFHFNASGQKYFTPLITPGLLEIYAAATH